MISFIALLFIGAQAWIYSGQLKVMSSQLKVMDDTQANVKEQTTIQRDNLLMSRAMNRAYVGVKSLTALTSDGRVTLVIENVGKLPADQIVVEVREVRRIGDSDIGSITRRKLVEPGQQLVQEGKMQLELPLAKFTSAEIERIAARTEKLYVSGTINYDDGFGNTQTTHFGFEYTPFLETKWTPTAELLPEK